MANLSGFNASTTPPMDDFSPMPDGDYRALISESKVKETKAHDGASFLEFTWELLDEPYRKRKQWSRLNLWNPNQQAVEIAQKELSSICRAVGVMSPNDSEELHGIPCILHIGTERRSDTGDLTNRIRGYKPINAAPTTPATAPQATPSAPTPPTPPPKAAAPAVPPWRQQ